MLIKIRPIDYYKCDKFPNVPVTKYIEYTYYDKVIKKGLFMIIDNFMFNNEKELLELRYHMLKDVVDYFVLSEGNHTYTGEPKPFYGRKYVEELGLDIKKFIFLQTDTTNELLSFTELDKFECERVGSTNILEDVKIYARLRTQKDAIATILDQLPQENLVIMHSDVDEIPKPDAVKYIASVQLQRPDNIMKIPLVLLEGRADRRLYTEDGEPAKWERSFMFCLPKHILHKGVSALRSEYNNPYPPISIVENNVPVLDLGWHFTWMGPKSVKLKKHKSTAHSTAAHLVNNVSEETKDILKEELGDNFAEVVKYHARPYPHENLPKEIFLLPNVKNYLFNVEEKINAKIVDYFMYFNEKELLELRYHMLKDVVDLFVISESDITFSGKEKTFNVEKVIQELGLDITKFKIIKNRCNRLDEQYTNIFDIMGSKAANDTVNVLAWTRERIQRDAITTILDQFDDDCVFCISDIDEIIRPNILEYFTRITKENQHVIIKIPLVLLESRADKRLVDHNNNPVPWDRSMFFATKKQLEKQTPHSIRGGYQDTLPVVYALENGNKLEDLGWHFTWMGNMARKKMKAINYGHAGNLKVVNTLSDTSAKQLETQLGTPVSTNYKFGTIDYDINNLPKEIFNLEKVKEFLLPPIEEPLQIFDDINHKLDEFIYDPQNPNINFDLAHMYEKLGQTAAAISYYLRTTERTEDKNLQFESMLRVGMCFESQRNRNFTVAGTYNRAITINPHRMEGYYLIAKHYLQINDHQAAYLYSTLGLELADEENNLRTDIQYPGRYAMEYIQAKSGYFVGFYKQSKNKLLELQNNLSVDDEHKLQIEKDLKEVVKV